MSDADRRRWDERHHSALGPPAAMVEAPERFAANVASLPTSGHALDLACGDGRHSVWLAQRGLDVLGVDVSPVAIEQATALARAAGIGDRGRFAVWDLDAGLPDGPPAAVVLCHRFRDARLDRAIVERLAPGGVLAIVALSEVGAEPGRFRVGPGELVRAFSMLEIVDAGEADGEAWLLARR